MILRIVVLLNVKVIALTQGGATIARKNNAYEFVIRFLPGASNA